MATPVPYTGAPGPETIGQGRIEDIPISPVRVEADPNAFGVNIAAATAHLGRVTEDAGKEMFDRAYAMQELQVHADVMSRITQAQKDMAGISANYGNLEGNNAVNGFPQYQQDLDKARTGNGAGLTPYGQELYDQETRSWQGRLQFYGAEHSAQELKRYSVGAAKAQEGAANDMIGLNPKDDAMWNAAVKQKLDSINHYADLGGVSDVERKQMTDKGLSDAILDRAHALGADDPMAAKELLNKALQKKQVLGDRVEKEIGYVNQRELEIGSRHFASATMSGAHLEFGNQTVPIEQAQVGIKAIEGGHYGAQGPETRLGHGLGAYQVMNYNLEPWLREAGMPQMSEAEFKANPQAQDALFNFKFGQYMQKYGTFNAAAKAWFGGEGNVNAPMDKGDGYHSNQQYLQTANAALAGKVPLSRAVEVGRGLAQQADPLNTELQDETQRRIESQYAATKKIAEDTEFNTASTIYDKIYNGVGPNKKLPTTLEELNADPDAKQAWDYISLNDPRKLGGFLSALAKNARGDVALTPERLQTWQVLAGESIDNPDKFMQDTAPDKLAALDLPRAQKNEILTMQKSIYAKSAANPPLGHAINLLTMTGVMDAAGLTKGEDDQNRFKFIGALGEAMQVYQQVNGKPMDDETVKSTAQQLLAPVTGVRSFWHPFGGGSEPRYQSLSEVPKDAADSIAKEMTAKGQVPSEQGILQVYLWAQFQELYGKGQTGSQHVPQYGPKHVGGAPSSPIQGPLGPRHIGGAPSSPIEGQ